MQLTDKQKNRIQQVLREKDAHRQVWFIEVCVNDYKNDEWLLRVNVYYLPTETKGRLRRGKILTLHAASSCLNPFCLSPPVPSDQWPKDSLRNDYYQVASPEYPFPPLFEAPRFRDIPFIITGDKTEPYEPYEKLIALVDFARTLPDSDFFTIHRVWGALTGFSTFTQDILVAEEGSSWIVNKRRRIKPRYHYKIISKPESELLTSLTKTKVYVICIKAIKERLKNATRRTVKTISKLDFKTYPGSTKSLLTFDFISTDASGLGKFKQAVRCHFVDDQENMTIT